MLSTERIINAFSPFADHISDRPSQPLQCIYFEKMLSTLLAGSLGTHENGRFKRFQQPNIADDDKRYFSLLLHLSQYSDITLSSKLSSLVKYMNRPIALSAIIIDFGIFNRNNFRITSDIEHIVQIQHKRPLGVMGNMWSSTIVANTSQDSNCIFSTPLKTLFEVPEAHTLVKLPKVFGTSLETASGNESENLTTELSRSLVPFPSPIKQMQTSRESSHTHQEYYLAAQRQDRAEMELIQNNHSKVHDNIGLPAWDRMNTTPWTCKNMIERKRQLW